MITSLDPCCPFKTRQTLWKNHWPWFRVTTHECQLCTLFNHLGRWKIIFCSNFNRPEQRKSHFYGMASMQIIVSQHNQLLSSIVIFGGLLQLWCIMKAEKTVSDFQAPRENIPPSIILIRHPISLKNLGCTCYLNALIQMTFSFLSMQRCITEYMIESEMELAKAMNQRRT